MKTPAIQNDFSYYRRIVSRQRIESTENMLVSTELANRMSLFYAHATPMLKVLSEATSKFVNDNADDVQNTTETLGTMAKVCLRMLENPWVLEILIKYCFIHNVFVFFSAQKTAATDRAGGDTNAGAARHGRPGHTLRSRASGRGFCTRCPRRCQGLCATAAGTAGDKGGAATECATLHDEASEWWEHAEEYTHYAGRIMMEAGWDGKAKWKSAHKRFVYVYNL